VKGDHTPVKSGKGGRPRKPVKPALTVREALFNRPRGRSVELSMLRDGDLCALIAKARHGQLTTLVTRLARRKKVSLKTAWGLVPRAREIAQRMDDIGRFFAQPMDDIGRFFELTDDEKLAVRILKNEPEAMRGWGMFPANSDVEFGALLHNAKPSEYREIIDTLKEIARSQR
jgi:hypothetical protein